LRRSLSFTLAALLIAPAARPGVATHEAWKWERAIVANPASPAAEQCAVLDSVLFAGSAPGLRDVRLLQDGHELAYAIDESVDEHATSDNDRSIYDTVATTAFTATDVREGVSPGRHESVDRIATAYIPARVPVERLRLIVDDTGHRADLVPHAMQVTVVARPQAPDHMPREPEIVALQAAPEHLLLPVTLGANLQDSAGVTVHVDPAPASLLRVALEMRRREICYQPLSGSPVTLLFGNAKARPVHYEFGRNYQPKAMPLLSTMGPTHANPAFHEAAARRPGLSLQVKLILAMLACAFALVLTLRPLLLRLRH
jgi:hypothetical protein